MSTWELEVFHAINAPARDNAALDALARVFVGDYFVPVVLSLILLGLWLAARDPDARESQQRAVLAAILAVGVANLLVLLFNETHLVMRPRPYIIDLNAAAAADTLFYRPLDPAFPSNSMAVAFAMAAAVWSGNRRVGAVMAALGALMGLARIYTGVHFPLDIAAGIAVGLASGLAGVRLLRLAGPVPSAFLGWARRLYLA